MDERPTLPASPHAKSIATFVLLTAVAWLGLSLLDAGPANAQRAWVKGEVRLNIRTGPGTQFRIVGLVKTGDEVRIQERGETWTKVRLTADNKEGWIPAGYLEAEPPPAIRLAEVEAEVARLRQELDSTTGDAGRLRESNSTLASRDAEQRAEIDRLTQENIEMRAGARVPELITGATILAMGMIVGALLHRSSGRRPSSRIRL